MVAPRFRTKRGAVVALGALALLVTAGCVESAALEQASMERDQAQRALWQKDRQVQALQWQLGYLGQQVQDIQSRDQASQRQLFAQLDALKEQNRMLSERLTKEEARVEERPIELPPPSAAVGKAAPGRPLPEDLARIERLLNAQHAQVVEMISRLEKLVRSRDGKPSDRYPERARNLDVLDPWGYGDRK
jgi:hypothetical protein